MVKRTTLKRRNLSNPQIKSYVGAIKRGQKSQHVLPATDGWVVKRAGATRASEIFTSKGEAVKRARDLAIKHSAEVFVHGRDGRIQERNSY